MIDTEVLGLVGRIYDAAIAPEKWEATAEEIRVRQGWHNIAMAVMAGAQQTAVIHFALGVPEGFDENANRHMEDIYALWGGAARIAAAPIEEPLLMSDFTDPAGWIDNTYYREWAVPQGLTEQAVIVLARDRTTVANMSFGRHGAMMDGVPGAIAELRVLAPHLRRAATISQLLEYSATRARTFEAALDAASTGAVLVRGDMSIVHANSAADTMLQASDTIRSVRGRLQPIEELVPGELEGAVDAAQNGAAALGRRGIGIPMRRRDGSPLVAHVMPLEGRGNAPVEAAAAVFLADTAGAEPLPTEKLSLLFGLTPAETRVFEMAAAGESPEQMAGKLGIAPSTVRTHLQRVYEKTGRHRQVELVALGRELKLPL